MITYETRLGKVEIANEYFSKLIGNTVTSCYGVSSMVATKGTQWLRSKISKKQYLDTGIVVSGSINKINVHLNISVTYGMNLNAICNSISHKVKYVVEQATGIVVNKVTVHIESMQGE